MPAPVPPQVSLLIPARNAAQTLGQTVNAALDYLNREFPGGHELILIPNDRPGETSTLEEARRLEAALPSVRCVPHEGEPGKGVALRTGFKASKGAWIFFTDADLPYELEFFTRAAAELRRGTDFITGNRRLATSQFSLPVELLPVAFRRHRLGLGFNRLVQALFRVGTSDTQAGIKAMTRDLAERAFADQVCPGFFFDLEFFLTARGRGFRHRELPVVLRLESEKSTVRVLRESFQALVWLSRILGRKIAGAYGRARTLRVSSLYSDEELASRLFLEARWRLTPYSDMERELPGAGPVLDLGCGHGLLSFALASRSSRRAVIGVDHDEKRIGIARRALAKAPAGLKLRFETGSAFSPPEGPFVGVTLIDVMHYFPPEQQMRIFEQAYRSLEPGGVLLVREVDPGGGWAGRLNRIYEKIATATGFTRSEQKSSLHFRSPPGWAAALAEAGFRVRHRPCTSALFADVLFVATKEPAELRGTPA